MHLLLRRRGAHLIVLCFLLFAIACLRRFGLLGCSNEHAWRHVGAVNVMDQVFGFALELVRLQLFPLGLGEALWTIILQAFDNLNRLV